jgi:hypothetical protein
MTALKDEVLDRIAAQWNVAQFASFGPGADPAPRYARIKGAAGPPLDLRSAVEALLVRSSSGTVNVRSFTADRPKGNPFHYGLDAVEAVAGKVRELAAQGFLTIVNETIDVHDGGVSGVRLGDLVEFAPGGTPRVVEEPGILSMPFRVAEHLVSTVYGTSLPDVEDGSRVEFSVHPHGVGLYEQRIIVWELESDQRAAGLIALGVRPSWPNRFSEHVGDKVFGLLVADALGASVPRTEVLARSTPPFAFGRPTGYDARWVRTAPRRFAAGRFTTTSRWIDPFQLLAKEDPDGSAIGAVLVQEAVRARWSGAARLDADSVVVEGVAGAGDQFMLGEAPPGAVPADVEQRVADLCRRLAADLGPVRLEWADDGETVWTLQLNQLPSVTGTAPTDSVATWLDFDPLDGLDVLRSLIDQASRVGAGISVVRAVGLTSHVGDLLRQGGVPARFAL